MVAFFVLMLIVALLVERWSLKHALSGVKYDVQPSKSLVEIGEKFDVITTLRTTERRIVPFLKISEDVPRELDAKAKRQTSGFDKQRAKILSSTYLMPMQKVTRRMQGSLPARGR